MNGNIKTIIQKVPIEWNELLMKTIEKIEANGFPEKVFATEIVRLLVHYRPAREHLNKSFEEIIKGFQGIQKVRPEVEKIMKEMNHLPIQGGSS